MESDKSDGHQSENKLTKGMFSTFLDIAAVLYIALTMTAISIYPDTPGCVWTKPSCIECIPINYLTCRNLFFKALYVVTNLTGGFWWNWHRYAGSVSFSQFETFCYLITINGLGILLVMRLFANGFRKKYPEQEALQQQRKQIWSYWACAYLVPFLSIILLLTLQKYFASHADKSMKWPMAVAELLILFFPSYTFIALLKQSWRTRLFFMLLFSLSLSILIPVLAWWYAYMNPAFGAPSLRTHF